MIFKFEKCISKWLIIFFLQDMSVKTYLFLIEEEKFQI